MVTTEVGGDTSRYGVVEASDGRVTGFEYKPDNPKTGLVTAEVFLYDAAVLLDTMDFLAGQDEGLQDYGHSLIPHLVANTTVVEHRLDGYWRDVGTVQSYWEAHMELLRGNGFELNTPGWGIRTASQQLMPAFIAAGADVTDSLVAAGATVRGTVSQSVVGNGVIVEEGAVVTDSILLDQAVVSAGATVTKVIADAQAHIEEGAVVGGPDDITVLAARSRVPAGSRIPAGASPDSGPDAGPE
jgi:glucose-1-phosphate adenylyltransferase